jgi:protein-S-isoprenylcysteine O-methyltransferase Ste14
MKRLGKWLLSTAAIAAVLLLAGNPRDPWLWAFIIGFASVGGYAVYSMDDDLARERFSPPDKGADRLSLRAVRLVALAAVIAAIVDIRFGWTIVATPLRALGLAAFLLSFMLIARAMGTNRFFSAVVRIQNERGHRVVDTGPYAVVRHPGYAAMIVAVPMIGLALGSWIGAGVALVYSALILRRVTFEDGFLQANLPGYGSYAARVPHKLIPGVW